MKETKSQVIRKFMHFQDIIKVLLNKLEPGLRLIKEHFHLWHVR